MVSPIASQYGAAMSPAHPYIDGTIISIGDDDDVVAEEPQCPIPPPAYQGQASPFDPMPNHMGWNVPQPGGAMTGAQVYGTPAYKTQGGPPYMGQHSDIPTNGDPYAVQHTYPSPPMRYGNWPSQTPYGMDVGAPDARQVSHPQMQYLRGANSPTLQAHHDVVSPSQLAIATPGFGHNNIGYLNATGHPSAPYRPNIANASFSSQHSNGPDPNPNSWTKDQDGLVYSLKTKRKKVTVKQIGAELKRSFKVERSDNAISKRWKIIKRRSSRVEPKDVAQNVMTPSLQLLNVELAKVVPGGFASASDPQLSGIKNEAEECFHKGYTKVVEEYMFNLQKGQAQAQTQAQAQAQGQGQGQGLRGRPGGGANL